MSMANAEADNLHVSFLDIDQTFSISGNTWKVNLPQENNL